MKHLHAASALLGAVFLSTSVLAASDSAPKQHAGYHSEAMHHQHDDTPRHYQVKHKHRSKHDHDLHPSPQGKYRITTLRNGKQHVEHEYAPGQFHTHRHSLHHSRHHHPRMMLERVPQSTHTHEQVSPGLKVTRTITQHAHNHMYEPAIKHGHK